MAVEQPMDGKRYDIAVVGGGAVGLAGAIAFAKDGFKTALIGPSGARRDGRTIALLHGSVRFLQAIGVWEDIEPSASPLATMQIVDDSGSLFRPPPATFNSSEIGLDAFGWNVENAFLVEALERRAGSAEKIERFPNLASGMRLADGMAQLSLVDVPAIEARLIVAADGRRSPLRDAAKIETRTWAYPQSALTTILRHDIPHRDASCEFHTRSGAFVLIPLPGKRSSLVWVTDTQHAKTLAEMSDEVLACTIERQAQSMLGAMRIDGPRGLVPMAGLSVDRYYANRLALAGEAAHVFPPLGAQGLNLGFRDVAALRDVAVDARHKSEDIGGLDALQRYQKGRVSDAGCRTAAVDVLNRTLLTPMFLTDFVRGAGLLALSSIGPFRRLFMRESVRPLHSPPRLMLDDA